MATTTTTTTSSVSSGLPVNLADAWKEIRRLQTTLSAVQEESARTASATQLAHKSEVAVLNSTVADLKGRLAALSVEKESVRARELASSVGAAHTARSENKHTSATIARLRSEVEKHRETIQKLRESESNLQDRVHALESTLGEREREGSELSGRLSLTREALEAELAAARTQAAEARARARTLESEAAQVNDLRVMARDANREKADLQHSLELAKIELNRLRASVASDVDDSSLVQSMQDEIAQYKRMLQQLPAMQEKVNQMEVLREENRGLREQVNRLSDVERVAIETTVENSSLAHQHSHWVECLRGLEGCNSPEAVAQTVNLLRQEKALLVEEKGKLASELAVVRDQLITQKSATAAAERRAERATEEARVCRDSAKMYEQTASFASEQQKAYRRIMDSYEREHTTKGVNDSALTERITELEAIIEKGNVHVATLTSSLETLQESVNTLSTAERDALNRSAGDVVMTEAGGDVELERVKAENKRLLVEIDTLTTELAKIESRVAKGEFNPATTKVLHFGNNPSKQAKMKTTNELKARIAELEAQLAGGTESSLASAELTSENNRLNDQLKQMEIRQQRLKEVCKAKIQEFREATYTFTGYRIDMIGQHQYRLRSMYAETADDYFLFQATSDGGHEMLETECVAKWQTEIGLFLTQFHSIPAFLSHVTTELFQQQTYQS